jgi:hypothetical protein
MFDSTTVTQRVQQAKSREEFDSLPAVVEAIKDYGVTAEANPTTSRGRIVR